MASEFQPDTSISPPRKIGDHGVIGNLSTIALVAKDGTIDFLCWKNFDSPTIFADLVDPGKGGYFSIQPVLDDPRTTQMYLPETNILLTRWLCGSGSAEIIDFMPILEKEAANPSRLIRRVTVTRGEVTFNLKCMPSFDYAREKAASHIKNNEVLFSATGFPPMRLAGKVDFLDRGDFIAAEFTLKKGEVLDLVLDDAESSPLLPEEVNEVLAETTRYWRNWSAQSTYKGLWQNEVLRSALILKLLTSKEHGSILAAGTFGLPEQLGGVRNWDYRATWIRDASFTVYALMRLGYKKEAIDFYHWIDHRAEKAAHNGGLHVMYSIDGSLAMEERELSHMTGYGGSKPVRIGNGARDQLQLDIYGELLDSVYLTNKYGEAISHDGWESVTKIVDYVCKNWEKPDAGIWEIRDEPRHFLHSRLMCWVAVDRAIRLASKRSLAAPFDRWVKARNEITADIWDNFWDEKLGHFVQSKGSTDLDASMLLMPLMRFVSATDPKWLSTLDEIGKTLNDDGMIRRYLNDDGLPGEEGAFAACSFWYVECLARAGRHDEARVIFEKVLHLANHLHLYAEEFDRRGELIGNFPQAFTHLALISAAFHLNRHYDDHASEWKS